LPLVHLQDANQAAWRASADDRQATLLRSQGIFNFISTWYAQPLWRSLRQHPQFAALLARRKSQQKQLQSQPEQRMADALSSMSTGRMVSDGGGGSVGAPLAG